MFLVFIRFRVGETLNDVILSDQDTDNPVSARFVEPCIR